VTVADYLPPVVAKLEGDHAGLVRTLREGKDKIQRWAVDVGRTKATLTVEAKLKDGTLAALRTKIKESPAAKLAVQLDLDRVQAQAIRAGLEANAVQVTIKPKMDQAAQRRIAVILAELGRRVDVLVRPTVDAAAALRSQQRLDRLARDRTATIRTVVIGGGGSSSAVRGSSGALSTLLSLAPAAVPVAAALTQSALSVAASMGAATAGVGAFGLAVIPQIKQMGDATKAQDKYTDAVAKYGARSQQALQAQAEAVRAMDKLPPATRRAAVGYMELRTTFKAWSDDVARFTMKPVEKSFAIVEALLPKLTPLVKGASGELDRLITVAGGEVSTPGFDSMMKRFTTFANGALKHGVDDVIHFSRVLEEGKAKGPIADFIKYAEKEGPAVRETLENIAKAVLQVTKGAAQAGPGILTVVNATAALVASLPVSFIARALQAYTALKLIKLTSAGITTVAGSITALSTRLTALRVASTTAGGGVAGVPAIGSLSTGAKIGGAVAAIGALVLVVDSLMSSGKKAPDVDKLTTSLGELGRTGKVSGEAAVAFGGDFDKLNSAIDRLNGGGSKMDHFNDTMNKIFTLGHKKSNSWNDAKKDIDSVDDALAQLVQSGKADLAAAAVAKLSAEVKKAGQPTKELTDRLDGYKSALADAKFEQELTAASMGLFGQQAQQVQKKLDAQKLSAQGLQQAILDLNDANRAGLDAESDYQQAIDDATKMVKHHTTALHYNKGELDLGAQGAREAYGALSTLAAKAEAASTAALQQGKSQDAANRILIDAHARLISTAEAMGLNTKDAKRFADQLDNIKDPKIQVTVNKVKAEQDLAAAQKKVDAFPKTAATKASFAYKQAMSQLNYYKAQVAKLDGTTAHVSVIYDLASKGVGVAVPGGGRYATGAIRSGGVRRMAEGGFGRPAMMARGGSNILWGEGPDESYIPHTRNRRSREIAAQTVGILGGSVSWGQDAVGAGSNVAAGVVRGISGGQADVMAAAVAMAKAAVGSFSDELGIASPSKKFRALGAYTMTGLVQGLTGSTASVKAAAKRIAAALYTDFGSHHKGLQQAVARDNAELIKLATQRDAVVSKLKAAQSKLASLQKSWTDERNSIASGIMQNASIITTGAEGGRPVNAADVIGQLQQRVKAATDFAAELRQLQKMGLRSDLIQQLANAGVDSAGSTVLALAGGSKSQIQQMNQLQASLSSAANKTGSAVADSMYGAGIKSAQGLVKGLQSQEAAIEKQMLRIAKMMQAAIKKALGIHSPSQVMAQLGDHTAQGMAVGIHRSTKHAVVAARGMAMAVQQGAAITGGAGGGYRGGDVHIHMTVMGHVTTERNLTEAVRAGLLQGGLRNSDMGLTPRR
jgi:hypothetical protein